MPLTVNGQPWLCSCVANRTQQLRLNPDPTPSPDTMDTHTDNTPPHTHTFIHSVKYFFKVFYIPGGNEGKVSKSKKCIMFQKCCACRELTRLNKCAKKKKRVLPWVHKPNCKSLVVPTGRAVEQQIGNLRAHYVRRHALSQEARVTLSSVNQPAGSEGNHISVVDNGCKAEPGITQCPPSSQVLSVHRSLSPKGK